MPLSVFLYCLLAVWLVAFLGMWSGQCLKWRACKVDSDFRKEALNECWKTLLFKRGLFLSALLLSTLTGQREAQGQPLHRLSAPPSSFIIPPLCFSLFFLLKHSFSVWNNTWVKTNGTWLLVGDWFDIASYFEMYLFWCSSTSEGTFDKSQVSFPSDCVITN